MCQGSTSQWLPEIVMLMRKTLLNTSLWLPEIVNEKNLTDHGVNLSGNFHERGVKRVLLRACIY